MFDIYGNSLLKLEKHPRSGKLRGKDVNLKFSVMGKSSGLCVSWFLSNMTSFRRESGMKRKDRVVDRVVYSCYNVCTNRKCLAFWTFYNIDAPKCDHVIL